MIMFEDGKPITGRGKKRKINLFTILMILFIIGFLVCTFLLVRKMIIRKRAEDLYEQMASEVLNSSGDNMDIDVVWSDVNTSNNNSLTGDIDPSSNEELLSETPDITSDQDSLTEDESLNIADSSAASADGSVDDVDEGEASPYDNILTLDQSHVSIDWDKLKEYNSDIYAWIYVPDTRIDYPILQDETDNTYYLNYNIDGTKGYPGCIYTENYNSRDFNDPCTVVYGHNMRSTGTMFRTLHYFEDQAFFDNHRYVYIYTPEETICYEVYAAVVCSSAHILKKYDFSKMTGISKFIKMVDSCRGMIDHIRKDMELSYEDKLLVLSTCIDDDAKRYNVICVKR